MKKKIYTSLYLWELFYPILFCSAVIAVQLMFYFRLENGTDQVQASTPLELFPAFLMLLLIVFLVLYMVCRIVTFDSNGIKYTHLKQSHFIRWEDVQYVKITLNSNDHIGYGSYLVIATEQNPVTHSDFRASREGFIVLRYRPSALNIVKQHYKGDIVRVGK